jgi:Uma2 family endonuclease
MAIYRKAGVAHYWLADTEESTLEAFMLKEGRYSLVAIGGLEDYFVHPAFPELTLDFKQIFWRPSTP